MGPDPNLIYDKIIFPGTVIDDQDPFMLGRIRASGNTDNIQSLLEGIPGANPQTGDVPETIKWTQKDPLMFLPFLPFFISQVPKVGENIGIIYQNPRIQYSNQFYFQGPFSTPILSPFEDGTGSQKNLGVGIQYKDYKPIKNYDGTYKESASIGVFPEPGDNSLLGRGSADVIVKENDVLIRAGKTLYFNPKELPVGYNKRAFTQLSQFTQRRESTGIKKVSKLNEIIKSVNYLIEYTLLNPENQVNVFRAQVYVYQFDGTILTDDDFTLSKSYQNYTTLIETIDIGGTTGTTLEKVVININQVLAEYNNDGSAPYFFRPIPILSKYLKSTKLSEKNQKNNTQLLYNSVKPNPSASINGSGLVFFKNAYGPQYEFNKFATETIQWVPTPQSFHIIGGDIVYLLSNDSQIPGKAKINLDGTLYGFTQEKLIDEVFNSTNSIVRGEELLKLIGAIVKYLVSHTHQYHLLPPGPVASNGSSREEIEILMQQAGEKILNKNIRIN